MNVGRVIYECSYLNLYVCMYIYIYVGRAIYECSYPNLCVCMYVYINVGRYIYKHSYSILEFSSILNSIGCLHIAFLNIIMSFSYLYVCVYV